MPLSTNPYEPKQHPGHKDVVNFVRQALHAETQRVKKPYFVEGPRGDIELTADHMFRMQGIVVTLLNDNADKIDNWMKLGKDDE